MSIDISGATISSAKTKHHAYKHDDQWRWRVTWLPGRDLTYTQAVTAMQLADAATRMVSEDADSTHPMWPTIEAWASELGVSGSDAYVRATDDPREAGPDMTVEDELQHAASLMRRNNTTVPSSNGTVDADAMTEAAEDAGSNTADTEDDLDRCDNPEAVRRALHVARNYQHEPH